MAKPAKRKDGLLYQQIELPVGADGKRRRKYVYARTKPELAAKVRKAAKEVEAMGDMVTTSPRLSTWLTRWLTEWVEPTSKPKTIANYRHMVALIDASIGAVKLADLKPSHVRRMLTYIQNEHVRPDGKTKGLSSATAANALRVLRKALNDAMGERLVSVNVAKAVKAPKAPKVKAVYLTADQAQVLLTSVASDPRAAIRWSLALMMAMRQAECLGLRADHIDLDAETIHIEWQLQRPATPPRHNEPQIPLTGGYYLTEPKSSAGERYLPMPAPMVEMMRRYLPTLPGKDALLCSLDGVTPRDIRADSREWQRALKAAGLPPVRLHSARHSALTLLAKLKVPDHIRQAIAGHASAAVTKQIYTHADMSETRDAMRLVGEAMAPKAIAG